MNISLYLTSVGLDKETVEDKTVVVIDVLRASTSICAALKAGAKGVIPTKGQGEAVEMWTKIGNNLAVLAGERGGKKIDDFQLGNSPAEFNVDSVGGKFVVMTTTNGTALFLKSSGANTVLCGGLVNISLLAERVAADGSDVIIACSGSEGSFSMEDTLCGGLLIDRLETTFGKNLVLNDAGSLALLLYKTNQEKLSETIHQAEHGRFLVSIGFAGDVETASSLDSIPVLPVLVDGRLVLVDD